MQKDLVFIISGGRTGTQFFGTVLGSLVEGCFSVHEPDVLGSHIAPLELIRRIRRFGLHHMITGRLLGTSGVRILANQFLQGNGARDLDGMVRTIRRYRNRYFESISAPLIVESNSQWYGALPALRAAYPYAKIVGIVRDPRTWVVSWANHGGRHDQRDLVTTMGQKRPHPAIVGDDRWADKWAAMTTFQRLCWDWKLINGVITDFAEDDADTRVFRFEDLFGPDPAVRRDFMAFITSHKSRAYDYYDPELAFAKRVNASSGATPNWPLWSTDDRRFLHDMCGQLMERYGYSLNYGHCVDEKRSGQTCMTL
jgi:hypothetical protein